MSSTDAVEILVVDDDDEIREAVVAALQDEGFRAGSVSNGPAAVEHVRTHPQLKLLLLDWNMAPLNGEQTMNAMREAGLVIPPVVLFTADQKNEKGEKVGAVAVLRKPAKLDDLYALATKYCRAA